MIFGCIGLTETVVSQYFKLQYAQCVVCIIFSIIFYDALCCLLKRLIVVLLAYDTVIVGGEVDVLLLL